MTRREVNLSGLGQTSAIALVIRSLATELSKFGQDIARSATLSLVRFVSFDVVRAWLTDPQFRAGIGPSRGQSVGPTRGLNRAPAPVSLAGIAIQIKEGHREHVDQTPEQDRLSAKRH